MLAPFFVLAAQSPSRQGTLRRLVAAHVALLLGLCFALSRQKPGDNVTFVGYLLLVAGIIEGAILVGWRLTQLPKSQALEFLLVSPLQPRWVFLGEALVGLAMLALVTLSGLPVLAILSVVGSIDPLDILPLTTMPFTWGAVTGLGLATWAYEPKSIRRIGEAVVMLGILIYLVVGVLAGENLKAWLSLLPEDTRVACLRGFARLHTHNPFGVVQHWLESDLVAAWERALYLELFGIGFIAFLLWRASSRLLCHFHERHYDPVRDVADEKRLEVGNRPLAWWAVKRVSEYSGRINLWLAGGFCLVYSAYLIGESNWPTWMGKRIFQLCEEAGGAPVIAAALVVLAAVPAAFQYGLWDSSTQARCKRLELLLLTELEPRDYWDAACAAAWARSRGYFALAVLLWGAAIVGGKLSVAQGLACFASGVLMWSLYFALGFRAFSRGAQANGLGMLLTVGVPLATIGLAKFGPSWAAAILPPGMVSLAGSGSLAALVGPLAAACVTLIVGRRALAGCDTRLRRWYDENAGSKVMG